MYTTIFDEILPQTISQKYSWWWIFKWSLIKTTCFFQDNEESAKINSFLKSKSKLNRVLSCKMRFLWLCKTLHPTRPFNRPPFCSSLCQNLFLCSTRNFMKFRRLLAVIYLRNWPDAEKWPSQGRYLSTRHTILQTLNCIHMINSCWCPDDHSVTSECDENDLIWP